jgi:hypothetical protein
MRALAGHVDDMRRAYPNDDLAIVFDIDGTIVDTRHLVVHILLSFDRRHGTDHFRGVTADDVVAHETHVEAILGPFALPDDLHRRVADWYTMHVRDPEAIGAAHRPYQGVLSVIRWFQIQPRLHVALNTGRPEEMRDVTCSSLNALGALHRVVFQPELLFMNQTGFDADTAVAKVEGLRRLRRSGYRIVAVVDNEPGMIRAMAEAEATEEVLFLHADTIFASRREPIPRMVSGSTYGLTGLVDGSELGRRVSLVWHGVNDEHNLSQLIASEVRWAELDVRRDPLGRLVLRHDSFVESPWRRDERILGLRDVLLELRSAERSVKLDLKEGGQAIEEILAAVHDFGFEEEELWFNASIEVLGEEGFRRIRSEHPGAILQTPIDFVAPLIVAAPRIAEGVLSTLRSWGISRLSLDWRTPLIRDALDAVEQLGWEVNIYGVPDLETFLEAALLLPASVTADFNFPEWSYFGRGPVNALSIAAGS